MSSQLTDQIGDTLIPLLFSLSIPNNSERRVPPPPSRLHQMITQHNIKTSSHRNSFIIINSHQNHGPSSSILIFCKWIQWWSLKLDFLIFLHLSSWWSLSKSSSSPTSEFIQSSFLSPHFIIFIPNPLLSIRDGMEQPLIECHWILITTDTFDRLSSIMNESESNPFSILPNAFPPAFLPPDWFYFLNPVAEQQLLMNSPPDDSIMLIHEFQCSSTKCDWHTLLFFSLRLFLNSRSWSWPWLPFLVIMNPWPHDLMITMKHGSCYRDWWWNSFSLSPNARCLYPIDHLKLQQ